MWTIPTWCSLAPWAAQIGHLWHSCLFPLMDKWKLKWTRYSWTHSEEAQSVWARSSGTQHMQALQKCELRGCCTTSGVIPCVTVTLEGEGDIWDSSCSLNTSAQGQEHTLRKGLSHGVHDPLGFSGFSNKNFKHSIIYWKVGEYLEESPSSYLKEHRRTGHFC